MVDKRKCVSCGKRTRRRCVAVVRESVAASLSVLGVFMYLLKYQEEYTQQSLDFLQEIVCWRVLSSSTKITEYKEQVSPEGRLTTLGFLFLYYFYKYQHTSMVVFD